MTRRRQKRKKRFKSRLDLQFLKVMDLEVITAKSAVPNENMRIINIYLLQICKTDLIEYIKTDD